MERKWYYAVNGVRYGPVTFEELRVLVKNGRVKALDLVWQPEFGPEWRNAGQVRMLFSEPVAVEAVPPTLTIAPEMRSVPLLGVAGEHPSCVAAVSQAFDRTTRLLFRPFDITRWFSIGFCAWLAYLGAQSMYNLGEGRGAVSGTVKQQVDAMLVKTLSLPDHPKEVAVVGVALLVGLLFALWMCALRSRGDFMFLHRWYKPDAPILQCWQSARAAGHDLFVWRLYFFFVSALLFAGDGVLAYAKILKPYVGAGCVWSDALVPPMIACGTAAVLVAFGVQVVAHLAKAFVVPVMYWHGVTAARAWLAVFALCNQYPVAVLGYLVCGAACWILAVFAIVAFVLLTCCIGCIPLIIPYVGSVVLLPVLFFFRGYAVCFLSRWRSDLVPEAE